MYTWHDAVSWKCNRKFGRIKEFICSRSAGEGLYKFAIKFSQTPLSVFIRLWEQEGALFYFFVIKVTICLFISTNWYKQLYEMVTQPESERALYRDFSHIYIWLDFCRPFFFSKWGCLASEISCAGVLFRRRGAHSLLPLTRATKPRERGVFPGSSARMRNPANFHYAGWNWNSLGV